MDNEELIDSGYMHGNEQKMTVTSVEAVQNIYEELKYNKFKSNQALKRTAPDTFS